MQPRHGTIDRFAALTTKELQRSSHRSATDITDWINRYNDDPKAFVWTKTANDILTSVGAFRSRQTPT